MSMFVSGVWQQFVCLGCVCVGGWLINFIPFLLMEKTLFLYHYLPALCYLHLLSPALLEHVQTHLVRYTHLNIYLNSSSSVVLNFIQFLY